MTDLALGVAFAILLILYLASELITGLTSTVERDNGRVWTFACFGRAGSVALLIIVGALLAGCATTGGPVIKTEIQEVRVPVAVYPVDPAKVPAVPKPLPPRPDSASAAADLLLAKVCEFVGYALKADPLVRAGAGQSPVAAATYPECERQR